MILNKSDIFINIAGGIKIDEPSIDLAVAMSIYSSFRDIPVDSDTVILGEIGLSGWDKDYFLHWKKDHRGSKLRFKRIIIPKGNLKNLIQKKYKAEITGVEK